MQQGWPGAPFAGSLKEKKSKNVKSNSNGFVIWHFDTVAVPALWNSSQERVHFLCTMPAVKLDLDNCWTKLFTKYEANITMHKVFRTKFLKSFSGLGHWKYKKAGIWNGLRDISFWNNSGSSNFTKTYKLPSQDSLTNKITFYFLFLLEHESK